MQASIMKLHATELKVVVLGTHSLKDCMVFVTAVEFAHLSYSQSPRNVSQNALPTKECVPALVQFAHI